MEMLDAKKNRSIILVFEFGCKYGFYRANESDQEIRTNYLKSWYQTLFSRSAILVGDNDRFFLNTSRRECNVRLLVVDWHPDEDVKREREET
jgi:hypothetical protein